MLKVIREIPMWSLAQVRTVLCVYVFTSHLMLVSVARIAGLGIIGRFRIPGKEMKRTGRGLRNSKFCPEEVKKPL
jgi:hypothetical protein